MSPIFNVDPTSLPKWQIIELSRHFNRLASVHVPKTATTMLKELTDRPPCDLWYTHTISQLYDGKWYCQAQLSVNGWVHFSDRTASTIRAATEHVCADFLRDLRQYGIYPRLHSHRSERVRLSPHEISNVPWHSLSREQKLAKLDAELDEYAAERDRRAAARV